MSIVEGLMNKMRTFFKSPPYGELASEPGQRASSGRRLKGGRDRKPSGTDFSGGSAALNRRFTFTFLALLAALALCLLFLLPGGPLQAQDADGPIPYAENDTGAVATFTGSDPEDRMVYWSLAGDADTGEVTADDMVDNVHFMISSDGVLSFKSPPDYEAPRGEDTSANNTYKVVVVASDDAPGAVALTLTLTI